MTRLYEINTRGHVWETYKNSDKIDIFAYDGGDYHNGPRCKICGYGFCHHCHEEPLFDCDGYIDAKAVDILLELPEGEDPLE